MFQQYFAHHQEHETEIFTAYAILLLTVSLPTTTTGMYLSNTFNLHNSPYLFITVPPTQ